VAPVSRSTFLGARRRATLAAGLTRVARAAALDRIGVDYAYYNPPSLVLKQRGWLEEALAKRGVAVDGCSPRSNKAKRISRRRRRAVRVDGRQRGVSWRAPMGRPIKTDLPSRRPEWTRARRRQGLPLPSCRFEREEDRRDARHGPLVLLAAFAANGRTRADRYQLGRSASTPTGAWRSNAGKSMPGPDSILTWLPRSSTRDRGCSIATSLQHLRRVERA